MQETARRNDDDEYVREGGPYAAMIRDLVESGRYGSAAEVVLEGLALVRERELLRRASQDWLKREVQIGIDQADRGILTPANEVFDRLEAELKAKFGGKAE
jgi:antitoxin ParD1/3/4